MKEYMKLVEGHPRTWLQEMVAIVGESTESAHWAKYLALARKWLADTQGQHLPASDAVRGLRGSC
jgi:TorA maturation chaperone TorD